MTCLKKNLLLLGIGTCCIYSLAMDQAPEKKHENDDDFACASAESEAGPDTKSDGECVVVGDAKGEPMQIEDPGHPEASPALEEAVATEMYSRKALRNKIRRENDKKNKFEKIDPKEAAGYGQPETAVATPVPVIPASDGICGSRPSTSVLPDMLTPHAPAHSEETKQLERKSKEKSRTRKRYDTRYGKQ